MATSQYNYHPFHTIGAATVLLWDSSAGGGAGAWRPLGKVADAAVSMATEQAGKDLAIKGLTQPIARRNRVKRYSLAFRLLENAGPEAQALLYGEGSAQTAATAEVAEFSEAVRLYGQQWRELSHPYGLVADDIASTGSGSVAASGTDGEIPAGTYYYWAVPVYLDGESVTVSGTELALGAATVSAGQSIAITINDTTGLAIVYYRIYYSETNQFDEAVYAGSMTSASGTLASYDSEDTARAASVAAALVQLSSANGSTAFELGTDYLLEAEKGLIKRVPGGAIADGGEVVATYAYARPASVVTPLGDPVELERYFRVKLLQLTADDPNPAYWRETGVEFTFFKVNASIGDARWPFSEDGFSEGCSVTWDCLYDGDEAKVGTVRSTYGVLAEYA